MLARRIGRNELAAIAICRAYVAAQQRYAAAGTRRQAGGPLRDDVPQRSRQAERTRTGRRRAASSGVRSATWWRRPRKKDGRSANGASRRSPFHGYYFKILTGLAATTPDGSAARGFGLVAWPAQYDATGVMTFIVDQSGVVRQKDLGGDTGAAVKAMALYNPDASWTEVR